MDREKSQCHSKPRNSPPALQVCHSHCEKRDAHLTAPLASPEPGLTGTGKASRANLSQRLVGQKDCPPWNRH